MGELHQYHITMLVDIEKENAIRSLFQRKNWPCLLKVVTEDNVTDVIQSGFTDIFICKTADDNRNNTEKNKKDCRIVNTEKNCGDGLTVKFNTEKNVSHTNIESSDTDDTDSDDNNDHSLKEPFQKHRITSHKYSKDKKGTLSSRKKQSGRRGRKDCPQSQSHEAREINEDIKKTKFQCSICGLYLATKASLHRHCQSQHGEEWFEFKCKDCPCMFKKLEELWKHRNDVKHDPPKVNPKFSDKKNHSPEELEQLGHLKCNACNKILPSRRLLRRHYYADHRECMPGPLCAVCGTEFKTRQELWKHKREMKHNDSLSLLQTYQCEQCGKVLTGGFSSFKLHQKFACKEVEDGPQIPCDVCGGLFKSKSHVQQHKKRTHINIPVVCDICGTVCKNKHSLNSHKRRHDDKNRKHVCDNCGKAFINKLLLIMHMRTHTKEKPFKCPLCDHRCAIKQNIQKHSLNVHKTQVKCSDIVTMSDTGLCHYSSMSQSDNNFKAGSSGSCEITPQERTNTGVLNGEKNSNSYNPLGSANDNERNSASFPGWGRSSLTDNEIYNNSGDKSYPLNPVDMAYDLSLCKQNTECSAGNGIEKLAVNVANSVDNLSAVKTSSSESYTELTSCQINPFSFSHTSMDSTHYTNTWTNTENR